MPDEAVRALRAIAVTGRLEVIRFLLDNPKSGAKEIIEGTGLGRDSLRTAIIELERTGFITTDAEGDRARRHVRYSIDRKRFVDGLGALYSYILG